MRFGAALGTALKRGARVVASRESAPAYRMIKRALISGLNSTGVQVADLRTLPAPVGKHLLKTQGYDAAFHVGAASTTDPEAVQIRLFERPGIALSLGMQKEVEKHFTRQELRRVPFAEVGAITYPARARESYASDLLGGPRRRGDPGARLPHRRRLRLLGRQLRAAARARPARRRGDHDARLRVGRGSGPGAPATRRSQQARRLVAAVNADFGAVFDRSAERIYLIDELGARRAARPGAAALPAAARLERAPGQGRRADQHDEPGRGDRRRGLEVVRTPVVAAGADAHRRGGEGVRLRGRGGRRLRLPGLPARLRRDRVPLQAARAARAGATAALGARCASCRSRRSSTAGSSARGR